MKILFTILIACLTAAPYAQTPWEHLPDEFEVISLNDLSDQDRGSRLISFLNRIRPYRLGLSLPAKGGTQFLFGLGLDDFFGKIRIFKNEVDLDLSDLEDLLQEPPEDLSDLEDLLKDPPKDLSDLEDLLKDPPKDAVVLGDDPNDEGEIVLDREDLDELNDWFNGKEGLGETI